MNVYHPASAGASGRAAAPQGATRYLGLAQGQVADVVITVAAAGRLKDVTKHCDRTELAVQGNGFEVVTGYIGKKRLTVIETGIGTASMDIVLNELDAIVNGNTAIGDRKTQLSIIHLGTCSTPQADVEPGKFLVSSHAVGLDNLLHYYKYTNNPDETYILAEFQRHTGLNGKPVWPYIAEAAISLRKHFGSSFVHGIMITTPGFYGPQGRAARSSVTFPNLLDALASFRCHDTRIVGIDMETASLYGLGKALGHKCLSISLVTENRLTKTLLQDEYAAFDKMIISSLQIISGM